VAGGVSVEVAAMQLMDGALRGYPGAKEVEVEARGGCF
jgi:hypothetical protein